MKLIYKHVKELRLDEKEIFFQNLEKISIDRKEKIRKSLQKTNQVDGNWNPSKNQLLSLAAGLILTEGLQSYGIDGKELNIRYNEHGKPYLEDFPDLHYNLSHSGDVAIGIFDKHPVGIDIEQLTRRVSKSIYRYFTEKECAFLQSAENEVEEHRRLLRLWTHKESFFKAVGTGIQKELFEIECIPGDTKPVVKDGKQYSFREICIYNDYVVTSCLEKTYTF